MECRRIGKAWDEPVRAFRERALQGDTIYLKVRQSLRHGMPPLTTPGERLRITAPPHLEPIRQTSRIRLALQGRHSSYMT